MMCETDAGEIYRIREELEKLRKRLEHSKAANERARAERTKLEGVLQDLVEEMYRRGDYECPWYQDKLDRARDLLPNSGK